MRRAIVHIGMPRSGTTSVQRALFDLRAELARHGLLYPDLTPASAAVPHLSHQHLGEALDGRRSLREQDELLASLSAQIHALHPQSVVLSYEGLVLAPRHLALPGRLRALFARLGYTMETLVTLKPQSEYLNSTYTWRTQFLKEPGPFSVFLQCAMTWPRFDYAAALAPWRRASDAGLHVIPLRSAVSDRPLVERVFAHCHVAGLLAPGRQEARRENPSPSALTVEVSRRLRQRRADLELGHCRREATLFIERLAQAAAPEAPRFQAVGPAEAGQIEAAFAARNAAFAAASWGGHWAALVAPEPARPVNELAGRVISQELDDVIEQIASDTVARFAAPRARLAALRLRQTGVSRLQAAQRAG